jgi:hypothetical protein
MALAPIQVLEGVERGRVFTDLSSPATIGREDDNAIQLNDERVSRFHAKIQEDGEAVILTDLDSTNGTRVNGRPVQMRVLQVGDQVSIGRCLLVYGGRIEIARSIGDILGAQTLPGFAAARGQMEDEDSVEQEDDPDAIETGGIYGPLGELFPSGPPELPSGLTARQQAELSDLIAFIHDRIRCVLEAAVEAEDQDDDEPKKMVVDWVMWQRLVALEMDAATYLRKIAEPGV